jgi:calcineurin-like phosphoesterase family protein
MARRVVLNYDQLAGMIAGESTESALHEAGLSFDDQALIGPALEALRKEPGAPDVMRAPNNQVAALLQTYLVEHAITDDQLAEVRGGAVEAQFNSHDIGWLRTAVPWIRSKLHIAKRAPRPTLSNLPVDVGDRCRIAILGDWGTGCYGARPIANTITREANYDVLLHLGDVYYSGSEREVREHFLNLWRPMAEASPNCVSRACNSNHEMYSGGAPYFHLTLPEFNQASPFFVLRNENWVLVGLDTAYDDHDLDGEQVGFLNQIAEGLDGRKLILFSHHQPYSLLSGQGPKLVNRLGHLLEARQIFAWYWGHEHLAVLYNQHPQWGLHGRCIGHSGFPYSRPNLGYAPLLKLPDEHVLRALPGTAHAPGAGVLDGPNDYLGDDREKYGPNGFLRIELDGPYLRESLVSPSGVVLWAGELT